MNIDAPIRVLVVDDHPLAQTGTRHFVNANPDMELVGDASTGSEALTLCGTLKPDVVLMDLMMPDMDGIETTRAIKRLYPTIRVIILTSFTEGDMVQRALKAGANGYLLKTVSARELANAVRAAYAGHAAIAREATEALINTLHEPSALLADLTEREREVLQLLTEGLSNAQIAERLSVTRATVKFHIGGIFTKFGVATRAEAIALAYKQRLV